MSHWATNTGRVYVECDASVDDARCGRRTFGRQDAQKAVAAGWARHIANAAGLSILDLPNGWRVAPYPDHCDHYSGPGHPNPNGWPWMLGPSSTDDVVPQHVTGDLHRCPNHTKPEATR